MNLVDEQMRTKAFLLAVGLQRHARLLRELVVEYGDPVAGYKPFGLQKVAYEIKMVADVLDALANDVGDEGAN